MSQINETLSKMQHLMYYKSEEKPAERQNSLEFMREGVDNKVYGIVHEGTSYYIKVAEKQDGKKLMPENFDYVGGFVNRGRMKYSSYTDALKNLDMHLQEVRTSLGKKAIVIESTNPGYKETLFTTATGELAEEIKRQRQIMANVKVIEEGAMMVTPVGKEIGKSGDSTPFGDKNIDTNKVTDGEGFSEKPKEAKESGEPAGASAKSAATAKDGLKQVPGAKNGVKAAEKPVMKEDKDFTDEPVVEPADGDADKEVPELDSEDKGKKDAGCDGANCDSIDDKLQTIIDRLSELENKVDKIPFSDGGDIVPTDDEEGAGDADAMPTDGDDDTIPEDGDVDIDLSLTADDDTENTVKESFEGTDYFDDEDSFDGTDNLEDNEELNKRFPWLNDADAVVKNAEGDITASTVAKSDFDKEAAEEEARRQADEDAMIYNPDEMTESRCIKNKKVNEGQGFDMIKKAWKDRNNTGVWSRNDKEHDETFNGDAVKNFVRYGTTSEKAADAVAQGKNIYRDNDDVEGTWADTDKYDAHGNKRKQVGQGLLDRAGRHIAVGVASALDKRAINQKRKQQTKNPNIGGI